MSEQYGYTLKDYRSCSVVWEYGCEAPPSTQQSTRSTCFRCGCPACKKCSVVRSYLRYGRRRICKNCIEDMREKP